MRVLLLLDSFREDVPGLHLYRLCLRWSPMRELQLSVAAFGEDGPLSERLREMGIGTTLIPADASRSPRRLREAAERFLSRSDRADLLQAHGTFPNLAARWFQGGRANIPLVSVIYDTCDFASIPILRRTWQALCERRTRRRVAAFVAVSAATRASLAPRGLDPARMRVIPTGVDAVGLFPLSEKNKQRYRLLLGIEADIPAIVSASDFTEGSGVLDLLDAMAQVHRRVPAARLFIVGEGPLREHAGEIVAARGLAESVRFIGHVSEVMPKLFSTADVVVHPSRANRCTLTVPDALATGAAVVATATGNVPEVAIDGKTALLVPPADPAAMAAAILRLVENADLRRNIAEAARDSARGSHEIGAIAEAYIDLWRDLAPDAEWRGTDTVPIEDMEDFKRESTGKFPPH